LNRRRRQQMLDGLPVEESPSETASEEDVEDSDDDDAGSQYDTATFLAHLPDVRPLLEPISRGLTSQASRAVLAPVEGEEELVEGRAQEGPSKRGSATSGVPQGMSVASRLRVRSPQTSLSGGTATSTSKARVPSSGVRTQG
jgi:hypothetical protein